MRWLKPLAQFAFGHERAREKEGVDDAEPEHRRARVYDIQNNTITGASQLGTVGTDWKFSGLRNFNGNGSTDLLLRNDHTGGLQVYDIKDDKIRDRVPRHNRYGLDVCGCWSDRG